VADGRNGYIIQTTGKGIKPTKMVTLYELKKLSNETYPEKPLTLVLLFIVWGTTVRKDELASLLKGTGISLDVFIETLMPYKDTYSEEDEELLTSCLLTATEEPLYGIHLLHILTNTPENRLYKGLEKAGLDVSILKKNIEAKLAAKKGVFAAHGIEMKNLANPLLQYGRDLTQLAEQGDFDALCDRPEEIDRLLEVLLRKQKANPALTGPAGVGKTALIELLARFLVRAENVPEPLKRTKLYEVSMGRLVAGTKYRGDFEERMNEIIEAIQEQKPAILFIDEMHLIWGAGRAEGVITDAANILKPFLGRGSIRVIGATTVEEYHRYIAQDNALARRFQEVRLEEPDEELTTKMVQSQTEALKEHHHVNIPVMVVYEAIRLTDRHLPGRFQPDKSVDLLDSTCVNVIRDGKNEVTVNDLLNTLSRQTGRPISSLTSDIRTELRNLGGALKKRIVGQDKAIEKVVATFIHRRLDLGPEEKNLGSFLFAGQTGVGKTELARCVADIFFSKRNPLLIVDCAEYSQGGTVNKLIGSPAGYAGSEKEGVLAEWLHTTGSGVILFDEIEKAHPDIHKLILGLLDNGRIMSSKGERLDCRQCIIILTTNALKIKDLSRENIGFVQSTSRPEITDLLMDHFPMELLARLDEQILFNPLADREMKQIILMRMEEAKGRMKKQGITLSYDNDAASNYLLVFLKKNKTGARGVERLIEKRILQPVSQALLFYEGEGGKEVILGDEFYTSGNVDIR
jgi:ATP-dependent Clp protease ATP-binding subunit ClpC